MTIDKNDIIQATVSSGGENLQGIKNLAFKYRENLLISELCRSIERVVDEQNDYLKMRERELEGDVDELQDEVSSLESEKEELEEDNAKLDKEFESLKQAVEAHLKEPTEETFKNLMELIK